MKIIIEGTAKEIADLVSEVQGLPWRLPVPWKATEEGAMLTGHDLPGVDDKVHTLSVDEIPRHSYGGKW